MCDCDKIVQIDTTFISMGDLQFCYFDENPEKLYLNIDPDNDIFEEFIADDDNFITHQETNKIYMDLDVADRLRQPCRHRKNKDGFCEHDIAHALRDIKSKLLKFLEN